MPKQVVQDQPNRHLKELFLLFSVPVGIIAIIIGFVYIPRLFANPAYDFIYCEGYYCDEKFSVSPSGTLSESQKEDASYSLRHNAKLFYYDVQRDATRPLLASEAMRYRLDPLSKSPDGYTLERTSSGGGFLFWDSGYRSGWVLNRGIVSKPITINTYEYTNKFIGWVLTNGE